MSRVAKLGRNPHALHRPPEFVPLRSSAMLFKPIRFHSFLNHQASSGASLSLCLSLSLSIFLAGAEWEHHPTIWQSPEPVSYPARQWFISGRPCCLNMCSLTNILTDSEEAPSCQMEDHEPPSLAQGGQGPGNDLTQG